MMEMFVTLQVPYTAPLAAAQGGGQRRAAGRARRFAPRAQRGRRRAKRRACPNTSGRRRQGGVRRKGPPPCRARGRARPGAIAAGARHAPHAPAGKAGRRGRILDGRQPVHSGGAPRHCAGRGAQAGGQPHAFARERAPAPQADCACVQRAPARAARVPRLCVGLPRHGAVHAAPVPERAGAARPRALGGGAHGKGRLPRPAFSGRAKAAFRREAAPPRRAGARAERKRGRNTKKEAKP